MQNLLTMTAPSTKTPTTENLPGRPATFRRQDIIVRFSLRDGEGHFEFLTNGQPPTEQLILDIESDQETLVFYLEGVDGPVAFLSNPFVWVDWQEGTNEPGLRPIAQPVNFTCFAQGVCCVIQDTNPLPPRGSVAWEPEQRFHFFLQVLADDRIYTSKDPSVVNKEPPPGGP